MFYYFNASEDDTLVTSPITNVTSSYLSQNDTVVTSPIANETTDSGYSNARLIANWISIIFGFPMLLTGMVGNTLTLIVLLSSRHYRPTSFGMLLILLSVCDIGVLGTGLLRHCIRGFTWDQVKIRNLCEWFCKVHGYFTYIFLELSPWTLCLVTLERTIAVKYPVRSRAVTLTRKRRMFGAWVVILLSVMSLNAVLLKKMVVNGGAGCSFDNPDVFMEHVMPVILGVMSYFVPGIIMFVMNIVIVLRLRKAQRERRTMSESVRRRENGEFRSSSTPMVVGICCLFLILNLPISLHYIYYHYWKGHAFEKNVVYSVAVHISYINNTFNFAMYCWRGRKFRRDLLGLFPCFRGRRSVNRNIEMRRNTTL